MQTRRDRFIVEGFCTFSQSFERHKAHKPNEADKERKAKPYALFRHYSGIMPKYAEKRIFLAPLAWLLGVLWRGSLAALAQHFNEGLNIIGGGCCIPTERDNKPQPTAAALLYPCIKPLILLCDRHNYNVKRQNPFYT